ncbi:MAG: DUF4836 family protein [Muribaculaceae bacterium]
MKSLKYLFCTAILLFLAACSKSGDELLRVIPENPSMVVKINMAAVCNSNNLLTDDGALSFPGEIADIFNLHNHSFFARLLKSLPASGICFSEPAYLFSASPEFSQEFIAPLSDSGATRKWLCNLCNENSMQSAKGIDYILNDGTLYAIADDILFIGAAKSSSNVAKLTDAVAAMMKRDGKRLADNTSILKALEGDADATAYIAVQSLCKQAALKQLSFSGFSATDVLSGMEIDALAMTINLRKSLDVDAKVIAKPSSAYKMMFGSLISKPSADFLSVMPASMSTMFSASLRGNVLLQMKPVSNLLSTARAFPIIRDFDFKKIINSIDGPVAIGISLDPDFIDEYNVVVAMASTDTDAVIAELNRVAAKYGKHPQQVGNENIYEYFNQRITVGVLNNKYVYFKLNTDDIDSTPVSDAELKQIFAESPICLNVTAEGYNVVLAFESSEKISCKVKPLDDDSSALITLIDLLCRIDTSSHIDDFDDPAASDDDFGGAAPIDEMTAF